MCVMCVMCVMCFSTGAAFGRYQQPLPNPALQWNGHLRWKFLYTPVIDVVVLKVKTEYMPRL